MGLTPYRSILFDGPVNVLVLDADVLTNLPVPDFVGVVHLTNERVGCVLIWAKGRQWGPVQVGHNFPSCRHHGRTEQRKTVVMTA